MPINEEAVKDRVLARMRRFRAQDRFGAARPQKFSQAELARLLGVSRTTVANIENKRQQLTVPMLYRISEVLDVPVADFLPDLHDVSFQETPAIRVAGEKQPLKPEEFAIAKRIEELRRRG